MQQKYLDPNQNWQNNLSVLQMVFYCRNTQKSSYANDHNALTEIGVSKLKQLRLSTMIHKSISLLMCRSQKSIIQKAFHNLSAFYLTQRQYAKLITKTRTPTSTLQQIH